MRKIVLILSGLSLLIHFALMTYSRYDTPAEALILNEQLYLLIGMIMSVVVFGFTATGMLFDHLERGK